MSGVLDTKDKIEKFRLLVLLKGLSLEIVTGMQLHRGKSAYSIIKKEFNLKGNKQKVFDQFKVLIDKRVIDPR